MRVIFFGTPNIAVPTLEALLAHKDINVLAAVTQPDRVAGRGQKLHSPPVKIICQKHDIPVFQPEKLSKSPEVVSALQQLSPDLIVMIAFGQILKKDILSLPKHGIINLHASLLPAYRGPAPINWALINGDTKTGITTMFTEAGLDTGPILLTQAIDLDSNINAQELSDIVATQGAQLVLKTIEVLNTGKLQAKAQDNDKATYAPILEKSMGNIDWGQPAHKIHNLVRGIVPWPLAYTSFRGNMLKIWRTELIIPEKKPSFKQNNKAGDLEQIDKRFFVCCADDWLEIKELQPINKSRLQAKDWINGVHITAEDKFDFIH